MRRPPQLPGTKIPDRQTKSYLATPYPGRLGIAQLWGENAAFYSRYTYDGVSLRGHNGVDFLATMGTNVIAVDGGQVTLTGFEAGGFGNYILLSHSWGQSIYAHLQSINVQQGQDVGRGAVIGVSGNSGDSSGPHLHFAIRINPYVRTDGWGGFSDPLPYLNPDNMILPEYFVRPDHLSTPISPQGQAAPEGALTRRMPPSGMAEETPGMVRP